MKIILANHKTGKVSFYVDDDCFDELNKFQWSVFTNGKQVYASARVNAETVLMHRLITNCPKDLVVDHIDGNSFNNQKSNLRTVSQRENSKNCERSKNAKGVYYDPNRRRWVAQCRNSQGIKLNLGRYKTEEEALNAYRTFHQLDLHN